MQPRRCLSTSSRTHRAGPWPICRSTLVRLWSPNQFAQSIPPTSGPQPAEGLDRASSIPSASHRAKRVHACGSGVAGGLGSELSSRARFVGGGGGSGQSGILQDRDVDQPVGASITMNGNSPVLRASARSIQGIGPLERTMPLLGRSLPDPGPARPAGAAATTGRSGWPASTEDIDGSAVELAGRDGNGSLPPTGALRCGLPLLAWAPRRLLQEPVFKAGPWPGLDAAAQLQESAVEGLVGLEKRRKLVADQGLSWLETGPTQGPAQRLRALRRCGHLMRGEVAAAAAAPPRSIFALPGLARSCRGNPQIV